MAFETINLGTQPAGTGGDTARSAFEKTNRNFLAVEVLSAAMSQAQFEAIRRQNKEKYAASGFVHFGKHYYGNPEYIPINEGLWTNIIAPNNLQMGKTSAPPPIGKSSSAAPVVHIAGVIFTLSEINTASDNQNEVRFPQAPDGKATYNKSTGAITTYATTTEAFNAQAADPTNVEVVINRVDMWGFEAWPEEVTLAKPFIYPNGLIQSKATQMSGVPTIGGSDRPESYYAMFAGDTTSKGTCLNFFALADPQKKKVLADPKNNMYFADDGRLIQWRLRVRSFAGAGNGDWVQTVSNGINPLSPTAELQVRSQGYNDFRSPYVLVSSGEHSYRGYSDTVWNDKPQLGLFTAIKTANAGVNEECYFLICGTVNRLNQGAYHPSFNHMGAAGFSQLGVNVWKWHQLPNQSINTISCFTPATASSIGYRGGDISNGKVLAGRPDERYYDAIYASGQGGVCRDMRYSAYGIESADFAEAGRRVKSSTYRGFEKLKFTKIIQTTVTDTAVYGGGRYFRFAGYQPWELFNQDSVVYFPRTNIIAYPCYIETWAGGAIYLSSAPTHADNGVLTSGLLQAFSPFVGDVASGDVAYVMRCDDINVSVGGSFLQTDVIGNPSNILATPALAQGWYGRWIRFKNELANIEVARKNLSSNAFITYTRDNGALWLAQSNYPFDFVTNEVKFIVAGDTVLVQYQAFAKQTTNAVNIGMHGADAGIGAVFAQSLYLPEWGCTLGESLCGIICKNTVPPEGVVQPLVRYLLNPLGEFNAAPINSPKHSALDMVAVPNNNSPAFKALNYNVNINQQANIQYAYTQLRHNGTNWGDDGKIYIVDNQSTKTDLNGNTVLVGTAKLKEPIGWIKNKV